SEGPCYQKRDGGNRRPAVPSGLALAGYPAAGHRRSEKRNHCTPATKGATTQTGRSAASNHPAVGISNTARTIPETHGHGGPDRGKLLTGIPASDRHSSLSTGIASAEKAGRCV